MHASSLPLDHVYSPSYTKPLEFSASCMHVNARSSLYFTLLTDAHHLPRRCNIAIASPASSHRIPSITETHPTPDLTAYSSSSRSLSPRTLYSQFCHRCGLVRASHPALLAITKALVSLGRNFEIQCCVKLQPVCYRQTQTNNFNPHAPVNLEGPRKEAAYGLRLTASRTETQHTAHIESGQVR